MAKAPSSRYRSGPRQRPRKGKTLGVCLRRVPDWSMQMLESSSRYTVTENLASVECKCEKDSTELAIRDYSSTHRVIQRNRKHA